MEGLLPILYRRIKNNGKTRPPQRNSLSSEAYNISDFYPEGYNYRYPVGSTGVPPPMLQLEMNSSIKTVNHDGLHRRWNSSVGDYYSSSGNKSQRLSPPEKTDMVKSKQQLVRFRSSRTFLSCVTGGAD